MRCGSCGPELSLTRARSACSALQLAGLIAAQLAVSAVSAAAAISGRLNRHYYELCAILIRVLCLQPQFGRLWRGRLASCKGTREPRASNWDRGLFLRADALHSSAVHTPPLASTAELLAQAQPPSLRSSFKKRPRHHRADIKKRAGDDALGLQQLEAGRRRSARLAPDQWRRRRLHV